MSIFTETRSPSTLPAKPAVRYRAIHPAAVAGAVVGGLSIVTALHWCLLIIPVVGGVLSWCVLRIIGKKPDIWTGTQLAWWGIGLSTVFGAFGVVWLVSAEAREVPYGYQWVSYDMLQPNPAAPTEPIPQTALDMQDRKVYIKGYMQARRRQTGIREFILCPANGECPFCTPSPKRTEMIRVMLQGDLETNYTTHLIGVAGRFRVNTDDRTGIPYELEADVLH